LEFHLFKNMSVEYAPDCKGWATSTKRATDVIRVFIWFHIAHSFINMVKRSSMTNTSKQKKNTLTFPIGSMVLVYMLTLRVYWWDPCYHI
jgi:hypothetical protein